MANRDNTQTDAYKDKMFAFRTTYRNIRNAIVEQRRRFREVIETTDAFTAKRLRFMVYPIEHMAKVKEKAEKSYEMLKLHGIEVPNACKFSEAYAEIIKYFKQIEEALAMTYQQSNIEPPAMATDDHWDLINITDEANNSFRAEQLEVLKHDYRRRRATIRMVLPFNREDSKFVQFIQRFMQEKSNTCNI